MAGSLAKKYLNSIKCLGLPLRYFVESGDLKLTKKKSNPTNRTHLESLKPTYGATSYKPILPLPPKSNDTIVINF